MTTRHVVLLYYVFYQEKQRNELVISAVCSCLLYPFTKQKGEMQRIRSCKALIPTNRSQIFLQQNPSFSLYSSQPQPGRNQNQPHKHHFVSPSRVQKLIAAQSDPLLAKEIFDYASRQPDFRHSYSSFLILILKLGRSRFFSLIDHLLLRLKAERYPVTHTLFSYLIKVYGEANFPQKALRTFHTMLEFDCKPLPKHLNRILEILVSYRSHLRPAFELFRSAHEHGVLPNTESYNILMKAFCFNGDLSIAYDLFNKMFKRDLVPNEESYRILMQGLCRKGQVNTAVDFLEDMVNKGYTPDTLSYTTLLNSLCRKKQLREAYKLLCRMKVKGCNPDIVHYNTVIVGFCREDRAIHACKVLEDMASSGCLPNVVSYRTLVSGLCNQGSLDESKRYLEEMVSKGFSPHFSVIHALVRSFCKIGRVEDACAVLGDVLKHGEVPHVDTWTVIVPRIYEDNTAIGIIDEILKEGVYCKSEARNNTRGTYLSGELSNKKITRIRLRHV
ncbi:pentatricopeptide repeat-containing protein At4g01400, mitochondrial [Humulus lupulus]|uniref:pentatricopeptide repeat-containing protein At4g01400, mitochondrial n=1 Tax=Humulus lupulus TaxID=3486 RepID=UPI002B40A4F6|nr:pentatricopeptide repeat-containing protein At4g01400, mitochondrial [Humulus lupulus]